MDVSYSSLFARDMDFPIQSIYLFLDPVSLKNSRLVCTQWDEFIKRRVWGTPKGSQPNSRLRQRLDYHWIHATPAVKSAVLQLDMNGPFNALNPVQSLSCDDSVIVLGLTDDQAKVYDFVSFNHLVDLDCRPPPSYQPHPDPGIINFGNVYADVGRSVVATVTDKGDVSVWRKSDWASVFKQSPHGNHAVTQVKVLPNLIITGGDDGKLALLSWDGDQVELVRMIEEGIIELPFPVPYELPLMNRICGLDSDGEWLLYGTMTKLNVWNLIDNTLAQSYDVDLVRSVALSYPYAVVTGDGNKLMVWDLRTGEQVKKLGVNAAYAIHHNKNILVGSDNTWGNPMRHRVNFFHLEQITNTNLKGPLWKRRKYLEDGNRAVKSCVNTSCLVTVQGDRLNVWDFWNCEEFNDNPDDFNDDLDELGDNPDEFSDSSDDYYDYAAGFSDGDGYSDNSGGFAENSDDEYPNGFGDNEEEYDEWDEIGHNPDGFGNDDVEYNGNPDELNDIAEVYDDNSDEFGENGAHNEYLDACGENLEVFSDNQDMLDIDADEFNENRDECGDNEDEFSDNPDELDEEVSDIPDGSGDNGEDCNDDPEDYSDHPDDNSDKAEEFSDEEEYSEDADEDYSDHPDDNSDQAEEFSDEEEYSEDADEDYSDDLDEDY